MAEPTIEDLERFKREIESEPNSFARFAGWYLYWSAYFKLKGLVLEEGNQTK